MWKHGTHLACVTSWLAIEVPMYTEKRDRERERKRERDRQRG